MGRMSHEDRVEVRRFLDRVNEMQAELSEASLRLHAAVNVASAKELAIAAQRVWTVREESRKLFERMDTVRQDYL